MKNNNFWEEKDVNYRTLKADELSRPTKETSLPFVIESINNCSFDFLYDFAKRHKAVLRQLLAKHGAILFRGFDITEPEQFRQRIYIN